MCPFTLRWKKALAGVVALFAAVTVYCPGADESSPALYVAVHDDGKGKRSSPDPVHEVTVAVTNLEKDKVVILTSLEFEGQLPETRYFYHGVYGRISKKGDHYEHHTMQQQLSIPVASCVLLPGQTATWSRPFRIVKQARVLVEGRTLATAEADKRIFHKQFRASKTTNVDYLPLLSDHVPAFLNWGGTHRIPPPCLVEDFEKLSSFKGGLDAEVFSEIEHDDNQAMRKEVGAEPDALVSCQNGFDIVYMGDRAMVLLDYDGGQKAHKTILPVSALVADIIIYAQRHNERGKVQALLDADMFGDLIKITPPEAHMYFRPGGAELSSKELIEVLKRAREKGVVPEVRLIDANSIGRSHFLVLGARIDDAGRPLKR